MWNASVPAPQMAISEVGNGNAMNLSIASNSAAALPPKMEMSWLSIERVCVSFHILSDLSIVIREKIYGRGHYYAHWFKMFRMTQPEHWKPGFFFAKKSTSMFHHKWGVSRAHASTNTHPSSSRQFQRAKQGRNSNDDSSEDKYLNKSHIG